MAEEILINVTPQETRVAVLDHGVIDELHIERASHRGLVGNIYLGRVARVLPGMQSAFIEIGLERAAFLHVADIWEYRQAQHSPESTPKPIEKLLHEGQPLIVQVIKDPIGTKGARLSTQISLAGRLLVHLPQDSHIGISQRIEDEAERTLLKETLTKLLPDDESRGGFIIRTMAERATERDLARDVEYLTKLWADVQSRARSTRAGTLVHQDLTLAERVLRDFSSENTRRVLVDSVEAHKAMLDFALRYAPTVTDHIQLHEGMRPLFDMYGVEQEIERALHRRVEAGPLDLNSCQRVEGTGDGDGTCCQQLPQALPFDDGRSLGCHAVTLRSGINVPMSLTCSRFQTNSMSRFNRVPPSRLEASRRNFSSIWRSDRGRAGWPRGKSTCALCVTPLAVVAVMRVGMVPGYTPSNSGSGMTRM